jgi:hypothetical protein
MHGYLDNTGRFIGTDYWFCSGKCYEKAFADYIPPRFQFGKTAGDDPELQTYVCKLEDETAGMNDTVRRQIQDCVDRWRIERDSYVALAFSELTQRLFMESSIVYKKEEAVRLDAKTKQEAERLKAEAEALALAEMLKPKPIPERLRFQHTHILAPSGFGKTTLLQQIILDDLAKPDPPAYVVIDPKGSLVERISRLALFDGRLADRIIIVDPTHAQLPALSMFSMPAAITDPTTRARVLNHLIETFAYIFSSADAQLTQRQGVPFGYVVRLVFLMGGDLNTLMDLLESKPDDPAFAPHIRTLAQQDDGARRFFANDFHSKTFGETRQQIKTRLYEIISKPELMQMFAAKENKISLFDCLQNRKIVLVNTAMGQLGTKASALLGRYFISMTLNAAFSRFAVPKDQWHPAYLVIDEFQDFADEDKTPELLRLSREYNLGVVLAHQTVHSRELNEALRTSISTNTNIKYSSNPEGVDLNYMARDLRCDADFLKKYATPTDTSARFACFARGMGLEHPFIVTVPFGNIQAQPQMSEAAYQKLLENNRKRVSAVKKLQPEPVPEAAPAPPTPEPPQDLAPKPVSTDTSSEAGKDW